MFNWIYILVDIGFVTALFYEYPLYCLPSFFKFWPTHPLPPISSTPTALFVALFHCFNGWLRHIWCVTLLNIMDLHMSILGTIVPPGGPCCVFHTHPPTHTGVNTLTLQYKYILTPPVMCSQQQFLLHWINNLPISKFTLHNSIMPCFSKITQLQTDAHQTIRER